MVLPQRNAFQDACVYGMANNVDLNQTIPSVAKIYMYLSKNYG